MNPHSRSGWPALHYADWRTTAEALHLYLQIVGKYRLARSPWVNHSWHATTYVTARGLTTSPVPDGATSIEVQLDLHEHRVVARHADGRSSSFALESMSVAAFHERFIAAIDELGGNANFNGRPNEIPAALPFAEDREERPYDARAVERFHQVLLRVDRVLQSFRTSFIGKVSPVHLFWGSFDLAVTRFSGRTAPTHPGGIPNLPDDVTREAYSHEVSSAGFWPGGGPYDDAAFYSYAYPMPDDFDAADVEPSAAYFDKGAGEYILPYEVVRRSADPEAELHRFLATTFAAAAKLGNWDASLQCPPGRPGIVRATGPTS